MGRIEIRDVTRRFGATTALDGVDLVAEDGEFLVLLGPSGCGKSTLLRMIAGLDTPTTGRIVVDGEDVTDRAPGERDLAVVFQSYALYPHMTVRRNLAFPLLMDGFRWWHHVPFLGSALYRRERSDRGVAERVARAADVLGITELLDRHPRTLSGGQRQRVALGRALVRDPVAFLMDEPLSNLDAKLRAETRYEILALHRRTGRTVVYVTHDQVEAMTMGTRVVVLRDGAVQQQGPPAEIYGEPASVFVARFLGTPPMNIGPGEWDPAEGVSWWGGLLPALPEGTMPAAGELLVGVRAEDLVVAVDTGPAEEPGVRGTVELHEDIGHETLVAVTPLAADAKSGVRRARLFVRHHGEAPPVGAPVRVTVRDGGRITLFDPATELRLGATRGVRIPTSLGR
ncbi:ABC transporter ATP-binding protein [Pseudonocardia sp. RS11V-5]|uniref:ABC transporter ATP-binding protein n=1 Tax=Pseudonocardia terrae TaxID=2905831 RepID=UPI001E4C3587|nr:ABC transporter ATP-binding protein [Pseudonocardia terrae]MCE3551395.1 ABC transporter ATP-binding protein [Pseudonocardia terrae]